MSTRTAAYVHASFDGDVIVVGLADRKFGTRRYVLLQRAKSCTAAERQLGHDAIHIEVDGQQRGCYGSLRGVKVGPRSITIDLDPATAEVLGIDSRIIFRTGGAEMDRPALLSALRGLLVAGEKLIVD